MTVKTDKSVPKVVLLRGEALTEYEAQYIDLLLPFFDLRYLALSTNRFATSRIETPIRFLSYPDEGLIGGRRSLIRGLRTRLMGQRYPMPGLKHELEGAEIVHTIETGNHFSYQAARLAGRLGFRLVVTAHENIPAPADEPVPVGRRRKFVIDTASAFTAISGASKEALIADGAPDEKITVIPHGIDLERFSPGRDDEMRDSWGVPEDALLVLFSGRLSEEKGLTILIGAAETARNIFFVLAGDGPQRGRIETEIEERGLAGRVILAGEYPYSMMDRLYRAADILVLPSIPTGGFREQFGFVLIEAMASGIPVIASRIGGVPEVVGDAGILLPPGDASALSEAIMGLGSDPSLRASLGGIGRKRCEEKFDRRRTARLIGEIYGKVLR